MTDYLLNPDMPAQEMKLHMGEMSAQEMRTARAAIRWANSKMQMPEDGDAFARLEVHNGKQVLAYVEAQTKEETGDYGPCLVRRCDMGLSITTTLGPWTDDDAGWELAEKALREMDMAQYAQACQNMIAQFSEKD